MTDHPRAPRMNTEPNGATAMTESQRTEAPKMGALPVGTVVLAFPGSRDGRAILTTTRSEPWTLPSGADVVMVEGYAGGIALTHIEVMR